MSQAPFRRATLIALLAIGGVSLACALIVSVFARDLAGRPETAGPDPYSRSALGHAALIELLERRGFRTLVSEHDSGARAGFDGVAVAFVPPFADVDALRDFARGATTAVVVLPKWSYVPDPEAPGRVGAVAPLPESLVEELASAVVGGAVTVRRPATSPAWIGLDTAPELLHPQVMYTSELAPIVTSDDGMLVGRVSVDGRRLFVVSDPDVLDNYGLGRGDNAAFAVDLFRWVAFEEDGPLVFDATLHGFERSPSLWRELLEFPLVLIVLHAVVTIALLLWSATSRFGAPAAPPPAIEPGKGFLIANTAALLQAGRHDRRALRRYYEVARAEVCARLHAPPGLAPRAGEAWLERVAVARHTSTRLADLDRAVAAATRTRATARDVLAAATAVHRWKQEMLHGPDHD